MTLDAEDREAIARAAERDRYRECECPVQGPCTREATWQDDDTGAWFCEEHAQ